MVKRQRKGNTVRDKAVFFLSGLPHVGVKTALKALKSSSPRQLVVDPSRFGLPERYLAEVNEVLDYVGGGGDDSQN